MLKNLKSQFWNVFEPGRPDSFSSGKIRDEDFNLLKN